MALSENLMNGNAQAQLNVAMCAWPMFGHFMPLLPYAEELLRRGHSVTIFHEDDPKYRRKIEECGLGDTKSVPFACQDKSFQVPIYDHIQSHYRNDNNEKPDVMVYDFFATDAADVADDLGIPAVGIFPNPPSLNPWAATLEDQETLQWVLWSSICNGLEGVLARILWCFRSKKRWSRSLPLMREQDVYPSPYSSRHFLGCASPQLEFPNLPSAPFYHMVGPSLPSKRDPIPQDLQKWMDAQEKPIVYVAFGTMYRHTPDSVRELEAQLLEANVAVLWSLPAKDQADLRHSRDLDSFRVESFVPQVAVLQCGHVAAFVTHCGSNSVGEALLSGVPMVCCPGMADQPANASRLARAGVGVIAKKKQIGAALKQLLDDVGEMTRNSKKLAHELESLEAAKRGADWIEKIAREDSEYGGPPTKGQGRWPWWPAPAVLAASLPMLCFL